MKLYIWWGFRKYVQKIEVLLKLTKITGSLHEDTFITISRLILLEMKNLSV
jgi:hypothetical protein